MVSDGTQMPRGAIPSSRSDIAAAKPYRPVGSVEPFVPTGVFPSPNEDLADAERYRAGGSVPESFIAWPTRIGFWGDENGSNSIWAEEAFAKACVEPKTFIPTEVVLSASRECGSSNFARFMQTRGFQMDRKAYLDGPFRLIDWMNAADLNEAIANIGPVKIGVASGGLSSIPHGGVTPGTSGWAVYGLPQSQPGDQCASLFGYGPWPHWSLCSSSAGSMRSCRQACLTASPMPCSSGARLASSTRQSLMNITGEAWVRSPTTIVKTVGG